MNVAKIGLKLAMLSLLVILTSCATRPTMAELELEAAKTGDWSEVERREALDNARLETTGPACPEHLAKVCVKQGPQLECACVPPSGVEQP